ncbi:hypothetical protein L195_g034201 [Trifolium pratense]|uniref:Uncharacterized protein n=1 Tax=Trifolium pratense TaxID=57577 RepID=A0A2K3LI62_TRIPR|nr:hypothetical protein L195_g034201 [Trifolium pratense]
MAERKTMRDYILGNQEITTPKRKTMGEYIIEAKLEAIQAKLEALIKRQFGIYTSLPCEHCDLVGHESEECPTRNLWDDGEIVHNGEQHDPHSFKRDINYIPPCLRRQSPMPMEELDINETLTTLNQNTLTELSQNEKQPKANDVLVKFMEQTNEKFGTLEGHISSILTLLSQKPQDSISTHVEPKLEEEAVNITLTSGVDLNEELRHEGQVSIESEEALTEESTCEEQHKQEHAVVDVEKSKESPTTLGLTIGSVVIEVHKGKGPLEKTLVLQDPSIMVDIVDVKISLYFEAHPPHEKRKNNVNQMIRKLRRGNALKVKFALGEPPD